MSLTSENRVGSFSIRSSHLLSGRNIPFPPNGSSSNLGHRPTKEAYEMDNADIQHGWRPKIVSDLVNGRRNTRDAVSAPILQRSLSARFPLPHSPAQSESDNSRASSSKGGRLSTVRKMFQPFVKSKSQRSPLSSVKKPCDQTISEQVSLKIDKKNSKSLLQDFSNKLHPSKSSSQSELKEKNWILHSNPANLLGILKLENKHGVPLFEFSVKCPEDVFFATTWKPENGLTRGYTFHSFHNRESSVVGQMQVSCYICAELKGVGDFGSSILTELVLYDISPPGKRTSSPDVVREQLASNEISSLSSCKMDHFSSQKWIKDQSKPSLVSSHLDSSTACPLEATELHPELEIAAILMQVPLKNRESPKLESLLNRKAATSDSPSGNIHIVIPSGSHSLPIVESRGPSSLLERWKLGGGCDCGGWDLACPLSILGNQNIQIAEDHIQVDNQHPFLLFLQGKKDNIPALTLRAIKDGQHYAVDFHAQLSSLQAFAICVAILHTAKASTTAGRDSIIQMSKCDSQSAAEGETKDSTDSEITEEGKSEVNKKL